MIGGTQSARNSRGNHSCSWPLTSSLTAGDSVHVPSAGHPSEPAARSASPQVQTGPSAMKVQYF